MLLTHMQRFTYSATGALRWKRDVTEYAEVLRNSHSPTTNAQASTLLMFMPLMCSFSAEATSTPQCWRSPYCLSDKARDDKSADRSE